MRSLTYIVGACLWSGLTLASIANAQQAAAQAVASGSDYGKLLQACSQAQPAASLYPPTALTAVTLRPIGEIVPIPATDGFIHLSYAAQVTNITKGEATISRINPADPAKDYAASGANSVFDVKGANITGKVRLFNPDLADGPRTKDQVDFDRLRGGLSGMTFFDVRYTQPSQVPHALAHVVAVQQDGDKIVYAKTDPVRVGCPPFAVLSPPLIGHGWWNGNGCCRTVGPHRGATLPINGDIKLPEDFAIDYVQLDASNTCCNGKPVGDNENWFFFRAPILAAAPGKVVTMVDGMPEQKPGPPVGVTAANAAGNHIIEDIGGGLYVLYAHLHTGSIPASIKVGSHLSAGMKIGELGNTGSSTSPHLHFQVMDRPSALDAKGVPFVFTEQRLEGTVGGTPEATTDAYEQGKSVRVDRGQTGTQLYRMPAAPQVFGYNLR